MNSKITTPLLVTSVVLIGAGIGYFASRTKPFTKTTLPSPSPTNRPLETGLPQYQDPKSTFPNAYIIPMRHTKTNKILVQMKGFLLPKTWNGQTVKINVGEETYTLLLPDKIKLICQPTTTSSQTKSVVNPKTKKIISPQAFLDLRAITQFNPNTPTFKLKNFFRQHPLVSLVAEDTGDRQTFSLKLIVGYGCHLK